MREKQTTVPRLLRILSLGGGVQSSTLFLMALHGEFGEDIPEIAIFADTQWEQKHVLAQVDFLQNVRVPGRHIPIHVVTAGNVREASVKSITEGKRFASLPCHVRNPEGKPAMLRRQCTREFKIAAIDRETRRYLGLQKGQRVPAGVHVERWLGITTDEASRMKDSRDKWATMRYPLVEAGMSRHDCERWNVRHGYPAFKKSACVGCPFHVP